MPLDPQLILFADSYLADPLHDRASAALVAWPELQTRPRAYQRASAALARTDVRAYLSAMEVELSERCEVTVEKWYAEVAKIAFASAAEVQRDGVLLPLHKLDKHTAAAISDIDEQTVGTITRRRYKLYSKLEALKLLGQSMRLLIERKEISGPQGQNIKIDGTMTADEATAAYMRLIKGEPGNG